MCTSIVLRIQVAWPREVAQMLSLTSLLGLTVDVVSLDCLWGGTAFFPKASEGARRMSARHVTSSRLCCRGACLAAASGVHAAAC